MTRFIRGADPLGVCLRGPSVLPSGLAQPGRRTDCSPHAGLAFPALSENGLDHMAMHISEPPANAVMLVGQAFMVEPKQMENGRVEVVDRNDVLDRLVAEVIGGAEAESRADPGAGEPGREAVGIMVSPLGPFLKR